MLSFLRPVREAGTLPSQADVVVIAGSAAAYFLAEALIGGAAREGSDCR